MRALPLRRIAGLALLAATTALSSCGHGSDDKAGGGSAGPKLPPLMPAEDRKVTPPPINLDGVWQAEGNGTLSFAQAPQFTDAGAKAFAANKAGADPAARCQPLGIPRLIATPRPFAITWNQDMIVMQFEVQRLIRLVDLSGRYAKNGDASFLGDAKAHWDKDALVIETRNQKTGSWLDNSGLPHGAQLTVTERIALDGKDKAIDQITITDPEMFKQPLTAAIKLIRNRDGNIGEDVCVERTNIHPK